MHYCFYWEPGVNTPLMICTHPPNHNSNCHTQKEYWSSLVHSAPQLVTYKPQFFLSANLSGFAGTKQPPAF